MCFVFHNLCNIFSKFFTYFYICTSFLHYTLIETNTIDYIKNGYKNNVSVNYNDLFINKYVKNTKLIKSEDIICSMTTFTIYFYLSTIQVHTPVFLWDAHACLFS